MGKSLLDASRKCEVVRDKRRRLFIDTDSSSESESDNCLSPTITVLSDSHCERSSDDCSTSSSSFASESSSSDSDAEQETANHRDTAKLEVVLPRGGRCRVVRSSRSMALRDTVCFTALLCTQGQVEMVRWQVRTGEQRRSVLALCASTRTWKTAMAASCCRRNPHLPQRNAVEDPLVTEKVYQAKIPTRIRQRTWTEPVATRSQSRHRHHSGSQNLIR